MYDLTYFKEDLVEQRDEHFEFKVGTKLIFAGCHKMEIREQNENTSCSGCDGLFCAPLCHSMSCKASHRKDGKNVIIVEVETGENLKLE